MHWAAYLGYDDIVRHLLTHGADPRAEERFHKWSPLHFAAAEGHMNVVKELLKAMRAPTGHQTSSDEHELEVAAAEVARKYGREDVAQLIRNEVSRRQRRHRSPWSQGRIFKVKKAHAAKAA